MDKIKTISALISTIISATAVADTNPCFTQQFHYEYPQGKDKSPDMFQSVKIGDGPIAKIGALGSEFGYYDITRRVTKILDGSTNAIVTTSYGVSSFWSDAVGSLNVSGSLIWKDVCNKPKNSLIVELWVKPAGTTSVVYYGRVRVDGN